MARNHRNRKTLRPRPSMVQEKYQVGDCAMLSRGMLVRFHLPTSVISRHPRGLPKLFHQIATPWDRQGSRAAIKRKKRLVEERRSGANPLRLAKTVLVMSQSGCFPAIERFPMQYFLVWLHRSRGADKWSSAAGWYNA